jgi:hypothetical protein
MPGNAHLAGWRGHSYRATINKSSNGTLWGSHASLPDDQSGNTQGLSRGLTLGTTSLLDIIIPPE